MKQTADPHAPLAGATIVITRPSGMSSAPARAVRALGGRSLCLPGLSLRPLRVAEKRPAKRGFDLWIFTSPAAVRFGAALLPTRRMRAGIEAFAVGEGTARALARHGIRAQIPRERSDSEGLLSITALAKVRGRRIALVGAPGGRNRIAPVLRRRGAEVAVLDVYERVRPRLTRRHFDAIEAAGDPLVMLVSSAEALGNLVALLPPKTLARLRGQIVVVSSERLAAIAHRQHFGEVVLARSAMPRDLLAAAAAALARHRL